MNHTITVSPSTHRHHVVVRWGHRDIELYGVLRNSIPQELRRWNNAENGWLVHRRVLPLLRELLAPWGQDVIWNIKEGKNR